MAAALVAVAANIVVANLLIGPLGLNGLAAAIAISAWLETIVLVVLLVRRVPGIRPGMGHVWVVMAKTVVVSFAGALVAYAVDRALIGAWGVDPGFLLLLVRISLAVAAGGLVILAGSLALRIDELRSIVGVDGGPRSTARARMTASDVAAGSAARRPGRRPAWDAFVEAQPPRAHTSSCRRGAGSRR